MRQLIRAAVVVVLAAPAAAQDSPPQTCTALVMPSVTGAEGNATDMATAVRDLFASYLTGPTLKAIPLDARLPSQAVEEARQKACGRVLVVSLTMKHHSGHNVFGQAVGQVAGTAARYVPGGAIARDTTASVTEAVSTVASSTRAKDELQIDYKLTTLEGQALITRTDKAKARADREDLITPLVERAATAIAAAK